MKFRTFLLIALLIFGALLQAGYSQPFREFRLSQEDNVRQAVFRYLMTSYLMAPSPRIMDKSEEKDQVKVCFLSLNGSDPSDSFMKRFRAYMLPIKKVSSSYKTKSKNRQLRIVVRDKTSGQRGIVYNIEDMKWLSRNKVLVRGGHFAAPFDASDIRFMLVNRSGHWIVVHKRHMARF